MFLSLAPFHCGLRMLMQFLTPQFSFHDTAVRTLAVRERTQVRISRRVFYAKCGFESAQLSSQSDFRVRQSRR